MEPEFNVTRNIAFGHSIVLDCATTMDDKRCEHIVPAAVYVFSYQLSASFSLHFSHFLYVYVSRCTIFRCCLGMSILMVARRAHSTHTQTRHTRTTLNKFATMKWRATKVACVCVRCACECGDAVTRATSLKRNFVLHSFGIFAIQQLYFRNASVSKNTCRTPFTRALVSCIRSIFMIFFSIVFLCKYSSDFQFFFSSFHSFARSFRSFFHFSRGNDSNMHTTT